MILPNSEGGVYLATWLTWVWLANGKVAPAESVWHN
jgi:hypothetical protein